LRVLGGAAGVIAGLVAILGPLLFISNELQERESAQQYGGQASTSGVIFGSLTVLVLAGLFGLMSFLLIRFSLEDYTQNKPRPNPGRNCSPDIRYSKLISSAYAVSKAGATASSGRISGGILNARSDAIPRD
jgi:hypothetical protein